LTSFIKSESNFKMSLKNSLKFSAHLSMMFVKETPSILERYALAKTFGFKGVECAFPYDQSTSDLAKAKGDLEQVLINVDPGSSLGFAALVGQEDKFMESLIKSLEYCKALNCKRLHIMSGKVTEDVKGSLEVLKSNLIKAIPLLEAANVIGLIEPINPYWVPGYFLNDFDLAEKILLEINHPKIRMMLDIFHLQYLKGNLSNNIPKYLPITAHVQIAQVPDRHEPNSDGEKNYKYVLEVLEKAKYDQWIGLEYIPAGNTKEGLSWIKEYGYAL